MAWFGESQRHSEAAKGNTSATKKSKLKAKLKEGFSRGENGSYIPPADIYDKNYDNKAYSAYEGSEGDTVQGTKKIYQRTVKEHQAKRQAVKKALSRRYGKIGSKKLQSKNPGEYEKQKKMMEDDFDSRVLSR